LKDTYVKRLLSLGEKRVPQKTFFGKRGRVKIIKYPFKNRIYPEPRFSDKKNLYFSKTKSIYFSMPFCY